MPATYFVDLDATDAFPEEATTVSTGGLFGLFARVAIDKPAVIIRFNESATDEIIVLPGTLKSLGRAPSRPMRSFQVKSADTENDSVVTLEFTEQEQPDAVVSLGVGATGAQGPQGPAGPQGDAGTPLQATLTLSANMDAPAPGHTFPLINIVGSAPPLTVRTDAGHEGRFTIPADTILNARAFVAATAADANTSALTVQLREVDVDGNSIGLYGTPASGTVATSGDGSVRTLQAHLFETIVAAANPRYFELEVIASTSVTNILANSRLQLG